MLSWLINLVLGFAVRQIVKWGSGVDFVKIKADLEIRIRALIPGDWIDDEAVIFVNKALDVVASLMSESVIEKILQLAVAKDFGGVLSYLKELIVGALAPHMVASDVSDMQLVNLIKEYEPKAVEA